MVVMYWEYDPLKLIFKHKSQFLINEMEIGIKLSKKCFWNIKN